ncbi:hypothetical protein YPPY14_3500, partial [Yersinia pestis PY-14]
MNIGTT